MTTNNTKIIADAEASASQDVPERFDVLYSDNPWPQQQYGARDAIQHYDLMTMDQLMGLGDAVKALAKDNAHLYLWVTNATLRMGYDVMEAWGFTPRSPLTWVKARFTLGNYMRNATEHVIFGTRGKAPVKYRSQPTWMFAPLQDHSDRNDRAPEGGGQGEAGVHE